MRADAIHVRLAVEADIDTIVRFNTEMARETEGIVLSCKRLTDGVTAVLRDDTKGFYVVAECSGKVVGQAMITYEWSDWRNSIFWWLQSVYVMPQYRRTGVFRALLNHIKFMVEERSDVCGLRLYVHQDNHTAKRTYENLGMENSHYQLYESASTSEEIES